jgi:hypothetical protein
MIAPDQGDLIISDVDHGQAHTRLPPAVSHSSLLESDRHPFYISLSSLIS